MENSLGFLYKDNALKGPWIWQVLPMFKTECHLVSNPITPSIIVFSKASMHYNYEIDNWSRWHKYNCSLNMVRYNGCYNIVKYWHGYFTYFTPFIGEKGMRNALEFKIFVFKNSLIFSPSWVWGVDGWGTN